MRYLILALLVLFLSVYLDMGSYPWGGRCFYSRRAKVGFCVFKKPPHFFLGTAEIIGYCGSCDRKGEVWFVNPDIWF